MVFGSRPDRFIDWTSRLRPWQAVAYVAAMTGLLSLAALIAGPHFSFTALFIVPIAFASWTLGAAAGLGVGATTIAIQIAISGLAAPFTPGADVGTAAGLWNVAMRVLAITLIVEIVGGFRRTFNELRRRARTDGLTGVFNKQAFDERVDTTLAIARRHRLSVVLAYADLDGFKAVNDMHGHAVGDEVLKTFARAACEGLRPTDCFARAGGDEFMALMTVDTLEHGYAAVTRLHQRVTAALDGMGYNVGCSMGAVALEHGGGDEAVLVQLADALMYEVKRAGKGALRIATVPAPVQARGAPPAPAARAAAALRSKLRAVQ